MKKITIKISVAEFSQLYHYCHMIHIYLQDTNLDYVSDSQMVLGDYFHILNQKSYVWHFKNEAKLHSLEMPLSTARIIAKDLLGKKINSLLQSILSKLDQCLVNHNCNIQIQDGTQNQVFC
ncbi:hypothetical protein GCM10011514_16980 [Emticicia aquatilis]|uniref:Uncharacterized protein n=1 Tax=Emticicia aquatilis TaxID=1537369 RepID=A0A917DPA2_9BACT|nr:hypothetical protein [Emticicia aquatilis]GGD53455.1 hypothetical protein GCM10011514_16980 [Emticicia aquatilis]